MGITNEKNDYPISRKYKNRFMEYEEDLCEYSKKNKLRFIEKDISYLKQDIEVVGKVEDGSLKMEDLDTPFIRTIFIDWACDRRADLMDLIELREEWKREGEIQTITENIQ